MDDWRARRGARAQHPEGRQELRVQVEDLTRAAAGRSLRADRASRGVRQRRRRQGGPHRSVDPRDDWQPPRRLDARRPRARGHEAKEGGEASGRRHRGCRAGDRVRPDQVRRPGGDLRGRGQGGAEQARRAAMRRSPLRPRSRHRRCRRGRGARAGEGQREAPRRAGLWRVAKEPAHPGVTTVIGLERGHTVSLGRGWARRSRGPVPCGIDPIKCSSAQVWGIVH
mmetsp:Transcript_25655/g.82635  ORF Transcript_25655/g.82635 Transcript_25655/m.82635 type:complete len:225 (-) Transcript_25655:44-718(-)